MPKQKQRDSDDRDAEVAPKRKTRRKRDHVADALREQQLDEQQIPRDDQGFRCVEKENVGKFFLFLWEARMLCRCRRTANAASAN